MSSIQELVTAVQSGLYRNHKWQVLINFPTFAGNPNTITQAKLLARTTRTPGGIVGVIEVPFEGRVLPLPGDRAFQELQITFLNVNDMLVRNTLESWQEAINGSQSNTTLSLAPVTLMADIEFDLLDLNDNVVKSFTMQGAWPTDIDGIDLDRGSRDSASEYTTVLRYIQFNTNTSR